MPGLASHPLRQLSPEQVQSLLNERGVGRQPGTVVHIHACLRVALRDAKRWHLVACKVETRDYVELAPAPEAEIQPFTPARATRFLAAAEGERWIIRLRRAAADIPLWASYLARMYLTNKAMAQPNRVRAARPGFPFISPCLLAELTDHADQGE